MNSTSSWFSQTFGFVRGNILVLTISGSLGMFSRSMVFPYVPLYVLSLGGDPEQVGIVYALGPLGGLLMFPIAGYLADHMNRPRLIALAGYFSAVMLLINAVAPTWEWVAAARLLPWLEPSHCLRPILRVRRLTRGASSVGCEFSMSPWPLPMPVVPRSICCF